MAFDLDPSYKDVPARIADFRERYPEGSLQPLDLTRPFDVLVIGDQTFIVYVAAAYRTPDDPRPGVGSAYEPFPGKTPYTKQSELQNAETSAWGRAIVAVLASESKSVASAEDVRNRQAAQEPEAADATCSKCKVTVANGRDVNVMRSHMVEAHQWVRTEDGKVAPPADPSGETPVIVSSDAPSPIPSHGDGDTAGAAIAAPAVAAAPVKVDKTLDRLQRRLDLLPETLRRSAEDELYEAGFMPQGVIACEPASVPAVSKVLDRFEEDANGAPGLQARAASKVKGTAA